MSNAIDITISEFEKLVGDNAFEIVARDKKARFVKYTKYLIRSTSQSQDKNIPDTLNKNSLININSHMQNICTSYASKELQYNNLSTITM